MFLSDSTDAVFGFSHYSLSLLLTLFGKFSCFLSCWQCRYPSLASHWTASSLIAHKNDCTFFPHVNRWLHRFFAWSLNQINFFIIFLSLSFTAQVFTRCVCHQFLCVCHSLCFAVYIEISVVEIRIDGECLVVLPTKAFIWLAILAGVPMASPIYNNGPAVLKLFSKSQGHIFLSFNCFYICIHSQWTIVYAALPTPSSCLATPMRASAALTVCKLQRRAQESNKLRDCALFKFEIVSKQFQLTTSNDLICNMWSANTRIR